MPKPVPPQTIAELEANRARYIQEINRNYQSMTGEGAFPENRAHFAQVIDTCLKLIEFTDRELERLNAVPK